MVVQNNNQMSDSEIIQLLSDYNLKDKEISTILKEIESRDFESVINFIEKRLNKSHSEIERDRILQDAREKNEQRRKEAVLQEEYRKRLISKIEANRKEQKLKEDAEIQAELSESVTKSVTLNDYIRIKAVVNDVDEYFLGFDKGSTIQDLFERLKQKLSSPNIKIKRFGYEDLISPNNEKLEEVLKCRSATIEVVFSK